MLSAFRLPKMHNVLANVMKGTAARDRAPVNHLDRLQRLSPLVPPIGSGIAAEAAFRP